ncbi:MULTISPECIES: hypothetical protein [Enterobacter]|uniref:hypothetical protein n=1 Tax=Enterobacter TaxID=547 RepID=UPI0007511C90|nr:MULTISPECIES: hypothetical protein [Enterobacter]KUR11389.1 hypothetical protein AWI34_13275 [Enterobacter roggenkampii]MDU1920262.1 hypothetical protein [Enterobacter sp.]
MEAFRELQQYIRLIAKESQSDGRDFSVVDNKLLWTTSAVLGELIRRLSENKSAPKDITDKKPELHEV